MKLRDEYPIDQALNDIENFFSRRVLDDLTRRELLNYLRECRAQRAVPFRSIYEKYVEYTNSKRDYRALEDSDKEMIDDLFYFWG